jgi:hypothetical protein
MDTFWAVLGLVLIAAIFGEVFNDLFRLRATSRSKRSLRWVTATSSRNRG